MKIKLNRPAVLGCAVAGVFVTTSVAAAQTPRVIFSGIAGDATNVAPGVTDAGFNDSTGSQTTFDRPFASPDGSWIGFVGDLEVTGTFFDEVVVAYQVGNPTGGVSVREGFDVPGGPTGRLSVAFDQRVTLLNDGTFGFTSNTRNGSTTTGEDYFFRYNGTAVDVVAQEGTVVNDGTLTIGIDSPYLASTGAAGYSSYVSEADVNEQARVIFDGATVAAAGNTPPGAPQPTVVFEFQSTHFGNNGQSYLTQARSFPPNRTVDTTIVNGNVVLVGGTQVPNSGFASVMPDTGPTFAAMNEAGTWFARGSNVDGFEWTLLNGDVLAAEGDSVAAGSSLTWSEFDGITVDNNDNVVLIGLASDGLQHAVFNGTDILASTGDGVDLDGNGLLDDNLFIRDFSVDDAVLSTAGEFVFAARLQDAAGSPMGQALLSVSVPEPATAGLLMLGGLLGLRRRR